MGWDGMGLIDWLVCLVDNWLLVLIHYYHYHYYKVIQISKLFYCSNAVVFVIVIIIIVLIGVSQIQFYVHFVAISHVVIGIWYLMVSSGVINHHNHHITGSFVALLLLLLLLLLVRERLNGQWPIPVPVWSNCPRTSPRPRPQVPPLN